MCLTKSNLLGALCKIPSWICLDLGKKMSAKILPVLLQKRSLLLNGIELPLYDQSSLIKSEPSTSNFV